MSKEDPGNSRSLENTTKSRGEEGSGYKSILMAKIRLDLICAAPRGFLRINCSTAHLH